MSEREKEKKEKKRRLKGDREIHRETARETERDRERQRETARETERDRERQRDTQRETDRDRVRETERQRERYRENDKEAERFSFLFAKVQDYFIRHHGTYIIHGSSEIGAHAWSDIGKLISLRNSFSRHRSQIIFC